MLPELYRDDHNGFIVIAHRGASAYYPENTMSAFRAAVQMGAGMIELDVLLTGDGVPVVFHDERVNRKTDGKGKVLDFTLDELKRLDAGSWFGKEFAGERIPTLEEALQFARGKITLNIEIKTEAVTGLLEGGVEEKSMELVKKYGMEKRVLFSSFDYRAVRRLKELDPGVPVALLYERSQSRGKRPSELTREYRADAFNCSYRQLSKKQMRDLKEHGIPVFVYTVNDERRMRKLIEWGVRGIFTDRTDLLKEVMETAR